MWNRNLLYKHSMNLNQTNFNLISRISVVKVMHVFKELLFKRIKMYYIFSVLCLDILLLNKVDFFTVIIDMFCACQHFSHLLMIVFSVPSLDFTNNWSNVGLPIYWLLFKCSVICSSCIWSYTITVAFPSQTYTEFTFVTQNGYCKTINKSAQTCRSLTSVGMDKWVDGLLIIYTNILRND